MATRAARTARAPEAPAILERLFKLRENSTTVSTEVIGGFTTFFVMAYIIALNPIILNYVGIPNLQDAKLGLTPTAPDGDYYECGEGTRFVISKMGSKPGGHTQMAFAVDDIAATLRRVRGVRLPDAQDGRRRLRCGRSEGSVV